MSYGRQKFLALRRYFFLAPKKQTTYNDKFR